MARLQPNDFTQLLQRPCRSRVRSDVAMNQTSTAMLDDYEHVQLSKRCRDGEEKVTRNDPLGVQAQKARPAHIASRATCRSFWQILVHRSRRYSNVELQQQFVGDALLAPRWILIRHPTDELLNLSLIHISEPTR